MTHTDPEPDEGPVEDRRRRGIEMMKSVYGWDIGDNVHGEFVELTVDHLFGRIWADGALSVRERRLVLLGLLLGSGQHDVVGLQLDCATSIGELSVDELRELVVFVAHYAGWPVAARLNQKVEQLAAKPAKPE
ncbi:MAG: carboxymuconolactone decarboxylase family protein [Actinobacteria bacterium]|nr:carboxymuconolactone decarboxylase family protein [Actinomycetota bacterium]